MSPAHLFDSQSDPIEPNLDSGLAGTGAPKYSMGMLPPHSPQTTPKPNLWETLTRIQWALHIEDALLAEMLGLPLKRMRSLRNAGSAPPAANLFGVADCFHLSIENLLNGSVDFQALTEFFRMNLNYIPDRYAESAFSKRRAALPVLTFLQKRYGDYTLDRHLRHFQVRREAFSQHDERINIQFLVDLCSHLNRLGFSESDFIDIGRFSVDANRGGAIEKAFQALRTPGSFYEELVDGLVNRYDENWNYSLQRLTSDVASVRLTQRPEVSEAMKTDKMGSALLCSLKGGVGASLLGFKHLPHAQVQHTRCIHRGDSECLYEFDFTEANRAVRTSSGKGFLRSVDPVC